MVTGSAQLVCEFFKIRGWDSESELVQSTYLDSFSLGFGPNSRQSSVPSLSAHAKTATNHWQSKITDEMSIENRID